MQNQEILQSAADQARGLAIDAIHACSSGHLGLPLGAAEIAPFFLVRTYRLIHPTLNGLTGTDLFFLPGMEVCFFTDGFTLPDLIFRLKKSKTFVSYTAKPPDTRSTWKLLGLNVLPAL